MIIDEELNLVSVWINHCISRMCLNAYLTNGKTGTHKLYSFEEFKKVTINTSKKDCESLAVHWIRIKELKPLYSPTNKIL